MFIQKMPHVHWKRVKKICLIWSLFSLFCSTYSLKTIHQMLKIITDLKSALKVEVEKYLKPLGNLHVNRIKSV